MIRDGVVLGYYAQLPPSFLPGGGVPSPWSCPRHSSIQSLLSWSICDRSLGLTRAPSVSDACMLVICSGVSATLLSTSTSPRRSGLRRAIPTRRSACVTQSISLSLLWDAFFAQKKPKNPKTHCCEVLYITSMKPCTLTYLTYLIYQYT